MILMYHQILEPANPSPIGAKLGSQCPPKRYGGVPPPYPNWANMAFTPGPQAYVVNHGLTIHKLPPPLGGGEAHTRAHGFPPPRRTNLRGKSPLASGAEVTNGGGPTKFMEAHETPGLSVIFCCSIISRKFLISCAFCSKESCNSAGNFI